MISLLIPPFLVAFLAALILVPLAIRFAKTLGFMDDPVKHKHPAVIHKKPIPRAGGLPIYLAIVIGSVIFLPMNSIFFSILLGGLAVVIVGLLDDKYDLSPYLRFLMNIVIASFVVFAGIKLPFITNPLGGILFFDVYSFYGVTIPLSGIIAVLWIVWVMNMLNWSKGIDGQMPGIAAISALIIGVASLRFPVLDNMDIFTSKMAFLVAGASVGFLLYNFYPAKIFPGYSSTILGFILGILSILTSVKLATAILVMGVPTADFLVTFARRTFSRKSPFWHDKGHLHHLLLDLGWSQPQIAVFYWVMSLILGLMALNLSSRGKLFAIILVLVLVSAFIVTVKFIVKRSNGSS